MCVVAGESLSSSCDRIAFEDESLHENQSLGSDLPEPAIAQLVEHLTVECCSNQMVPGSILDGRIDAQS